MKLKLSLPTKLLLLVVVPLAIELLFIAVLGFLLWRVEAEARVTERSRAIVASSGRIAALSKDACLNLIAYHLSHSKIFSSGSEKIANEINDEVALIKDQVGNDAQQLRNVDELKAATDRAIKLLSQVKEKTEFSDDSASLFQGLLMKGEIESVVNDIVTAAEKLGKREDEVRGKLAPDETGARERFEMVLVGGIVANLLIAFLATLYLNRNITSRLWNLIDNTMRLASGKELKPPLGGHDEIAALDATFREMANARYEADKLKREFLEMVSHDVRTPLMSVSATLEMIGMGLRPQMLASDVALAERNITQVLNLLSELLDLHRLDAGKLDLALEEADALTILNEAIETVRPNAEKLGVTIDGCDTTADIMCDPVRLRQVMINLLSNSVKFSPKGGTVTTSITLTPEQLRITISDQGPGIPREFKDKIFERFGQVKTTDATIQGGKGLGLAISRALIEAHAGKIGVDSEEGKGSDFWILLPRIQ